MLQYAAIVLIMLGLYGILTQRNIIKIILALNILEIGLNLFIVSVGYVDGGLAPILSVENPTTAGFVDPLPQALVLTAIVIGVGTTAVALAIAKNVYNKYGTFELDEMGEQ
jgi:multicomponent Na+:H+ antiporter subunit C